MAVTDLLIADSAIRANNEGRWKGRFVRSIPSEVITKRKSVVGIKSKSEMTWNVLARHEVASILR